LSIQEKYHAPIYIIITTVVLQLIAVPKAGIRNLLFGMLSKNSRYLSELYTDSPETWIEILS
jgi:hypothetical protein